jgi:group I intron endonuclease
MMGGSVITTGVVYAILNTANNKRYVGSTTQPVRVRWKCHLYRLRHGVHHSYKLQSAFNAFGEAAFVVEVLAECARDALVLVEKTYIDKFGSYNIASNPSRNGIETRWHGHVKKPLAPKLPASVRIKQEWLDPVVRANRLAGMRRHLEKPETRERLRTAMLGRRMPKEAVQKMAESKWKPVFCPELQITFLSQKAAAEHLGVLTTSVCNALKKKGKVLRKYTLERVA